MLIRALPPPDNNHDDMIAASEEVDDNPINENENDSDLSFGDDLDNNSGISSGDNSDDYPIDKAFVNTTDEVFFYASENKNNNDPGNTKDNHTEPEGVDINDAVTEGADSDTSKHDDNNGTNDNKNTTDTNTYTITVLSKCPPYAHEQMTRERHQRW